MRALLFILSLLLLASCRQVVDAVNMKQLAPELVEYGKTADAWYEYMPEYAPYFCLKTRCAIVYSDAQMQLGYWRLRHPLPPHPFPLYRKSKRRKRQNVQASSPA